MCDLLKNRSAVVTLTVLVFLFGQVSCYHLNHARSESKDFASLSSLESLQNKLDSILETENNEKELLENLLQKDDVDKTSTTTTTTSRTGEESFADKLEQEHNNNANMMEVSTEGIVSKNLEAKSSLARNRVPRDSPESTIQKLVENSKRMESMVIMLADLKNVLSQAVTAQENQMALRTEVVELREEIDYLRKEIRQMKSETAAVEGSLDESPKLENRIHNDEATIGWLKESVKELRHGLVEVSSSINVTGLLHMKQVWEKDGRRVNKDFQTIQKQIESLAVGQAQNSEALLEVKGDIADLRTWQVKMGEKFVQDQTLLPAVATMNHNEGSRSSSSPRLILEDQTHKNSLSYLAAQVEKNPETDESPSRHSKRKLRKEMKTMEKMIMEVVHDQTLLDKRLTKLEMSGKTVKNPNKMSQLASKARTRENFGPDAAAVVDPSTMADTYYPSEEEENQIFSQDKKLPTIRPSWKLKRNLRSVENYGASASFRLSTLERSMSDYANTLEGIDFKVTSLGELRNSNTQLYTALEGLEAKYDERLSEIQSTMAKLEASSSTISVASEECKEQQKFQSGLLQGLRKDLTSVKERSHSNSLRVAYAQSQMVTWGIKTCNDEGSESIQNIKIAAIEAQLKGDEERSQSS